MLRQSSPTKGFPGARKRARTPAHPNAPNARKHVKLNGVDVGDENLINAALPPAPALLQSKSDIAQPPDEVTQAQADGHNSNSGSDSGNVVPADDVDTANRSKTMYEADGDDLDDEKFEELSSDIESNEEAYDSEASDHETSQLHSSDAAERRAMLMGLDPEASAHVESVESKRTQLFQNVEAPLPGIQLEIPENAPVSSPHPHPVETRG